jgi:hypothetical protein
MTEADMRRCIFGNRFRPPSLDKSWLTWNGNAVVKPAQSIYDNRDFTRMPELADALAQGGCTNSDILDHCRQKGEHTRGCWLIDMILGKS